MKGTNKNNLFNRVILQSGSSFLDLAYQAPDTMLKLTYELANLTGCLFNSSNEKTIECLVNLDSNYLTKKQFEIQTINTFLYMPFVPTSDWHGLVKERPNREQFKSLNHDILAGYNENEGTYFTFYLFYDRYFNFSHIFQKNLTDNLEDLLIVELVQAFGLNDNNQKIQNLVKKNVLYNKIDNEIRFLKIFSRIAGDLIFNCPVELLVQVFKKNIESNVYFYKFRRRSSLNKWPTWVGVMHGDEIEFIFGAPWLNFNSFDDIDRLLSRKIMSYWANFAKTGKL